MTSTDTGGATAPRVGGRAARLGLGALAALLVGAGGWFLPLWQATLYAPQYPGGLRTVAWGHDVGGDLGEVNALNHYVGLGVFDPADVPEMALWPLALLAGVAAALLAVLVARRWPRRLALAYLWTLPIGVLAATQYRLHEFGQDVTPGAAFRVDPFTPWVVGRTTVWNFETWAWPGLGLGAIALAAALVTVGPRLLRRGGAAAPAVRTVAVAVIAASLALGGPLGTAGPALADTHDPDAHEHGRDHQAPGHGSHDDAAEGAGVIQAPPAPQVGPSSHPAPPTLVEHTVVGDLRELVEATPPGGTLRLRAGAYTGPVVIDEPIVIQGDGLPIVQGDGTGSVITVRAAGTEIRDVVVRGSGGGPIGDPAGIRIEADDVTVAGTVIEDSYTAIAVDSVAGIRIEGNHIHGRRGAAVVDDGHAVADDTGEDAAFDPHGTEDGRAGHDAHSGHDAHTGHDAHAGHDHGAYASAAAGPRGDGIWLHDVDHVLLRDNHISHARDGVFVSFGSGALLDGNHVHASRYAVHSMFARDLSLVHNHLADNLAGAVLMYGEDVLLLRNHVTGSSSPSTGFAVLLKDVVDVEATQNLLVDNRVGIHIDGPTETSDTTFLANTVARNAIGAQLLSSARVSFSANSFAANTVQALVTGTHTRGVAWADAGWGNFWSTYRGYDVLGHGRGALPHTEGGAVDRLLGRNPELLAIAGSPAMQLLRSVEERWGQRAPVLTDELPLTVPVSPALPAPTPDPGARLLGLALGAVLLLPALSTLLVRRPRRPVAPSRRSPRAVTV